MPAPKGNKNHLGHHHSLITRLLFSLQRRGKPINQSSSEKRSEAKRNYWSQFTLEERREKTKHLLQTDIRQTQEHIEKRIAKIKGVKNAKKSLSLLGNKRSLGCKHTLERRLANSEARKGDKTHLWLGGKSFEPYPAGFNNNLKLRIRIRDNFTCQLCGIYENGHRHCVHHIDYDKSNIDETNLVTLCNPCHTKTRHKRQYWQSVLAELCYNHFNRSGETHGDWS